MLRHCSVHLAEWLAKRVRWMQVPATILTQPDASSLQQHGGVTSGVFVFFAFWLRVQLTGSINCAGFLMGDRFVYGRALSPSYQAMLLPELEVSLLAVASPWDEFVEWSREYGS